MEKLGEEAPSLFYKDRSQSYLGFQPALGAGYGASMQLTRLSSIVIEVIVGFIV